MRIEMTYEEYQEHKSYEGCLPRTGTTTEFIPARDLPYKGITGKKEENIGLYFTSVNQA